MSNRKTLKAAVALLTLGGMMLGIAGCSSGDSRSNGNSGNNGGGRVDGAGLTRAEVERMSLREQFELVRERDVRMHELFAEAQLQISDEPWSWLYYGVIPTMGFNVWSVRGMNDDNSYFLDVGAATYPEGATGERTDLDPMIEYFDSKGWATEIAETASGGYRARADTGEGFLVEWSVRPNGQYNMIVTSKTYWGDAHGLLREVADRIPKGGLDIGDAVPGVRPPFPDWDDPAIYTPNLLDF